jgi:hypothetical protein
MAQNDELDLNVYLVFKSGFQREML